MAKIGAQALSKNPNWKGGRTVASNGYILVKRPDHPDADVRGYIYEHRLVAEQTIGRRLLPGEEVHHTNKNGDRADNQPGHLEVKPSHAHHAAEHRTKKNRFRLRMPDEPNAIVSCTCGCGIKFNRYDDQGRPRSFVSGHNDHSAPTEQMILTLLSRGPMKTGEIIKRSGQTKTAIATCLTKLRQRGVVVAVRHGVLARHG